MEIDKKQLKIARNYSEALLAIAKEQNSVEKLYVQLKEVSEIISKSGDLKFFFENPLISSNDKKEIIYKVFGKDFDLQIINLLNLLADNKRLELFDTVCYCYEKDYEKINLIQKVIIISAVGINAKSQEKLLGILKQKTGAKIVPEYIIQPDILGGLIIRIKDKIIDLSLKTKIKDMEKQLV